MITIAHQELSKLNLSSQIISYFKVRILMVSEISNPLCTGNDFFVILTIEPVHILVLIALSNKVGSGE